MDTAVTSVAVAALLADGVLAGFMLDKVIVQLPARQRIGVSAYAAYARVRRPGQRHRLLRRRRARAPRS